MKTTLKRIAAIFMAVMMCFFTVGCQSINDYNKLLSEFNALLEKSEEETIAADDAADEEKTSSEDNSSVNSKKKPSNSTSSKNKNAASKKADTDSSKKSETVASSSKTDSTNNSLDHTDVENSSENVDEEANSDESDLDLDGYRFIISSPWMAKSAATAKLEQEKIFFKVAKEIEDTYGCEIIVQGGNLNTVETLRPLIMSGNEVADVVDVLASSTLALASAGYIVPWNDIEGMDVTDDCFVRGYTNLGRINKDYYGLSFLRAPEARMGVMFNKGVLESSGIDADGIYDLVRNKQWTWDVLRDYAVKVTNRYTQNNNTSVWGLGGYYQKVASALYMSNGATLAAYKNGRGVTTFNSENMKQAMNYMDSLINTYKVYNANDYRNANTFDTSDNGDYKTMFQQGKLGFMIEETFWLAKYFDKSFEYGIVPVPMGPKASDYITDSSNARIWTCTSTNARSNTIDKTALILNMLAAGCAYPDGTEDSKDWWHYDVKKSYFINDQDDNLEMYNILLDTAAVDYGASVDGLRNEFLLSVVRDAVFCGRGSVENRIAGIGTMYDSTVYSALTLR